MRTSCALACPHGYSLSASVASFRASIRKRAWQAPRSQTIEPCILCLAQQSPHLHQNELLSYYCTMVMYSGAPGAAVGVPRRAAVAVPCWTAAQVFSFVPLSPMGQYRRSVVAQATVLILDIFGRGCRTPFSVTAVKNRPTSRRLKSQHNPGSFRYPRGMEGSADFRMCGVGRRGKNDRPALIALST